MSKNKKPVAPKAEKTPEEVAAKKEKQRAYRLARKAEREILVPKRKTGRPPATLTPEAIEERRRRTKEYMRAYQRNVRQSRYANDPEYRERVIARERARYRRINLTEQERPTRLCENAVAELRKNTFTEPGILLHHGQELRLPKVKLVRYSTLSRAIGVTNRTLTRWIAVGKFPKPPIYTQQGHLVWTLKMAEELCEVLAKFGLAKSSIGFHASEVETVRRLFEVQAGI